MSHIRSYIITSPEIKSVAREINRLLQLQVKAKWRARIREEAYKILGNQCQCGFNDKRALQIDHLNRNLGKEDTDAACNNIISLGKEAKKEYQLLCANCNWIKRSRLKEYNEGEMSIDHRVRELNNRKLELIQEEWKQKLLPYVAQGTPPEEIALKVGCCVRTIYTQLHELDMFKTWQGNKVDRERWGVSL